MKKGFLLFVTGIMAFVLVACGEKAEPTEGTSEDQVDDLTAEEVYEKALKTSEDMESAEVNMDMQQKIDLGDDLGSMIMDSNFDTEMTMDPLAMHMDGVTKMEMEGTDEDVGDFPAMDMEIYMVDDAMYLYSEETDEWIKMEGASMDAIEEMAGQQPDPADQLEMVEDYIDDLSFEQSDDEYILKLDADGEKYDELIKEMIEGNMPADMLEQMGDEGQEILDNMQINSISMEYTVDKETFDINSLKMDMDMTMEVEDEELNIGQNVEAAYSNINGIDAIEVPEEVKEEAVDQDEALEQAL